MLVIANIPALQTKLYNQSKSKKTVKEIVTEKYCEEYTIELLYTILPKE